MNNNNSVHIQYSLAPAPKPTPNGDHVAHVRSRGTMNLDALVKEMVRKGSTTAEADIRAVLADAIAESQALLRKGFRVKLDGLVALRPTIRGAFLTDKDAFDPARHSLGASASTDRLFQEQLQTDASVEKVPTHIVVPFIETLHDVLTDETNGRVSSSHIGILSGRNLKFDQNQPDEGIFFDAVDGSHGMRVDKISLMQSSLIHFFTPAFQPTPYYVSLRTRSLSGGRLTTSASELIVMGS